MVAGKGPMARLRILFTGATGLVGHVLYREALPPSTCHLVVHRNSLPGSLRSGDEVVHADLAAEGLADQIVELARPDVVLHAAALSSLDQCEQRPDLAHSINVEASRSLAAAAARRQAAFVYFSTDQVFDGEAAPYGEDATPRPGTEYGRSKVAAEEAVRAVHDQALILRIALVLGPSPDGRRGALDFVRRDLAAGRPVRLFTDEWRTPVSVLDLAAILKALLPAPPSGFLHVAGPERVQRLELGQRLARAFGLPLVGLQPGSRLDASGPRPRDVSLDCHRLASLGLPAPTGLDQALERLARLSAEPGLR